MEDIACPFRHSPRNNDNVAVCGLVEQLSGLSPESCEVSRAGCVVCSKSLTDKLATFNDVISSTLYRACQSAQSLAEPRSGGRFDRLEELRLLAEKRFRKSDEEFRHSMTHRCDVVIRCSDSSDQADCAVRSILNQQESFPVLHLVGDDSASGLMTRYESHPDVIIHRVSPDVTLFRALHDLVPNLDTPFVAVQETDFISRIDRLQLSLSAMHEHGLEIVACGVVTPDGIQKPSHPTDRYQRYAASAGLLFRRSTLVDMGGFSDRPDADVELMFRATKEGRRIGLLPDPLVETHSAFVPVAPGPVPNYGDSAMPLRSFSRGYPQLRVECDVVIPFLGQLELVDEAVRSVIEQQGAEAVVHLIDDATPGDTSSLLSRWGRHPSVRTYRNSRNIGQFASINNVFPFLETDLIAIQDGDDISLPDRLSLSGNSLRLADADLFGAAISLFGDTEMLVGGARYTPRRIRTPLVRKSNYPFPTRTSYYIQNPTTVVRRAVFGELGGYADFGDRLRNRTGLDTEFQIRAHLAGVRIALSMDVVGKYRVHSASATQDAVSGWGTAPRTEGQMEALRRRAAFVTGDFDPRSFGALRRFTGVTQRVHAGGT